MRSSNLPHFKRLLSATILALIFGCLVSAAAPSDAVVDAKRRAADRLVKDGKLKDAVVILKEIIAVDQSRFEDYLTLARAEDKLGQRDEAATAYKQVLALTAAKSRRPEERSARAEAMKRVAGADEMQQKVELLSKDFKKRIQDLVKDSERAGDIDTYRRLLKLQLTLRMAGGENDGGFFDVRADRAWQPTGLFVTEGRNYHIRAVGRWKVAPNIDCSADGTKAVPANDYGTVGVLIFMVRLTQVGEYKQTTAVSDQTWKAPLTGELSFVINEGKPWDTEGKTDNSGSVLVLVEPEQ